LLYVWASPHPEQVLPAIHTEFPMNDPADKTNSPPPISGRYLLVIRIPVFCNGDGQRYVDPLWRKDLVRHTDYISDFTLACPRIDGPLPEGLVPVDDPRITFLDLPGRYKLTLALPVMLARLWRGVGRADVVHSCLGGWMLASLDNTSTIFAKLRGKFLLIVVESSPWRIDRSAQASWLKRMKANLSEMVNRWCINMTDLAIFTQAEYKQSLLTKHPERGHVIHASWIDESNIASDTRVKEVWSNKLAEAAGPLKLLFAGRLSLEKGVPGLLDALDLAEAKGLPVHLDVLGEGELLARCQASAAQQRHATRLNLLGTVPYGPEFFAKLHDYHGRTRAGQQHGRPARLRALQRGMAFSTWRRTRALRHLAESLRAPRRAERAGVGRTRDCPSNDPPSHACEAVAFAGHKPASAPNVALAPSP
jgi:glycosyltransferase involved in cell wall biosynthesis